MIIFFYLDLHVHYSLFFDWISLLLLFLPDYSALNKFRPFPSFIFSSFVPSPFLLAFKVFAGFYRALCNFCCKPAVTRLAREYAQNVYGYLCVLMCCLCIYVCFHCVCTCQALDALDRALQQNPSDLTVRAELYFSKGNQLREMNQLDRAFEV